jgi:hypothetical protein
MGNRVLFFNHAKTILNALKRSTYNSCWRLNYPTRPYVLESLRLALSVSCLVFAVGVLRNDYKSTECGQFLAVIAVMRTVRSSPCSSVMHALHAWLRSLQFFHTLSSYYFPPISQLREESTCISGKFMTLVVLPFLRGTARL